MLAPQLLSLSVSAECPLHVGRPVVVDGRTHVLFQQQVDPLRVSSHRAVDTNTEKKLSSLIFPFWQHICLSYNKVFYHFSSYDNLQTVKQWQCVQTWQEVIFFAQRDYKVNEKT